MLRLRSRRLAADASYICGFDAGRLDTAGSRLARTYRHDFAAERSRRRGLRAKHQSLEKFAPGANLPAMTSRLREIAAVDLVPGTNLWKSSRLARTYHHDFAAEGNRHRGLGGRHQSLEKFALGANPTAMTSQLGGIAAADLVADTNLWRGSHQPRTHRHDFAAEGNPHRGLRARHQVRGRALVLPPAARP